MASPIKGIPVAPLTGVLDSRSTPDQLPSEALRMRQNLQSNDQGKLRRGFGWQKLLSAEDYNDEDFHDQLLAFGGIRQPVTMLFEAESTRKVRSLFLGTQGRIAELNEYSGSWRILGTGYGGNPSASAAAPRFKAAQVGDYLAFTNDFEKPMYHAIETSPIDPPNLLNTFPDLDMIGLSRAAVCWAWHNVLFFADVEMDGNRYAYRIVWSDFNNPLAFDPASQQSITGSKDLFSYERILAGAPFGNSFLIYTTHGIWEMAVVGGEQSFDFARRYNGEKDKGAAVLKYPNTLVSTRDSHVYCAEDGIYAYNPFYGTPDRMEWLHRASNLVYDDIDQTNCTVHCAVFNSNELIVSTAPRASLNNCPTRSLRANFQYKVADFVDAGFTSFLSYRSYRVPKIRDFIIENGLCDVQGLIDAGYGWSNENLPNPLPESAAPFVPKSFWTTQPQTIGDLTTEDWNKAETDLDSLCSLLGNQRLDDICRKCEGPTLLVAASSDDWCLKQLGDVFYREMCANPSAVGHTTSQGYVASIGSYTHQPYDSILRFAPMFIESPGQPNVILDEVKLGYLAVEQRPPSLIGARVGISAQTADSNTDKCGIVWFQHSQKELRCLTNKSAGQHMADGTVPAQYLRWAVYRVGRFIHVELKVSGVGGDCEFSNILGTARRDEAKNY